MPTTNDAFREALGFSPADYADSIPNVTLLNLGGTDQLLEALLDGRDDVDRQVFTPSGTDTESTGFALPNWALPIAAMIALIALIALTAPIAKWYRRRRRTRRLANGDIAAAWEDITERLSDLGEIVRLCLQFLAHELLGILIFLFGIFAELICPIDIGLEPLLNSLLGGEGACEVAGVFALVEGAHAESAVHLFHKHSPTFVFVFY